MANPSPVAVSFSGCTFTSQSAAIQVGNGFISLQNPPFRLEGTLPFSALTLTDNQVLFSNNAPGAAVNGVVTIPIAAGDRPPSINATNFSGIAQVSWNARGVPRTETLSAGNPVFLDGFGN